MDLDVLIVGGGPAGISTWLHLHKLAPEIAARSALIEKAAFPRENVCGGGVTWPGNLLLDELDIEIESPSAAVHRVEFRFGEKRETLRARDAIQVVRRLDFDHELVRIATERGLALSEGETLQGLSLENGWAVAETDRGRHRARVVVGADGAHSTVRSLAGLSNRGHLARLLKVVGPAKGGPADPERTTVLFDFTRATAALQGYFWRFPCFEGGEPATDWGLYDSRIDAGRPRADLRAIFEAELVAAGADTRAQSWKSHPVRRFDVEGALAAPNVILVGDAAGVDPILGEGISPSLEYGEIAARALLEAFEDGDFSMGEYRDVLFGYRLGNSLRRRTELAQELYASGAAGLEAMQGILREWIAEGLP